MLSLQFLGTGNAAGFPLYGCQCHGCERARHTPALKRTQCSALITGPSEHILIDAGQMDLQHRFAPGYLDAILLTHFHPDHVQGLLHFRWGINHRVPVYCPDDPVGCADLFKYPGILQFNKVTAFQSFSIGSVQITPVPLQHSKPTLGYLVSCAEQNIAYLTDTKGLGAATTKVLAQASVDTMIIDCSFAPGSEKSGHNNLDDVRLIDRHIQPKQTVLTHIGHDFDVWLEHHAHQLPDHFIVANDGMTLTGNGSFK